MAKPKYIDFDLLIDRADQGYTARVLRSPAGEAAATFRLPPLGGEGSTQPGPVTSIAAASQIGEALFAAVFAGEVGARFKSSLDIAGRQGAGLRLRLRLANVPELAALPWEYLRDAAADRFLALSAATPIVRYLELPEPVKPLAVKPPLHVLVIIAAPTGLPPLDGEKEWARLAGVAGSAQQRGLVTFERMQPPTLPALLRRLRASEYHVIHFIGHGAFDEQAQEGLLLLEDEAGGARPVSGQDLGTILHDARTLRLAVLNACEGARVPERPVCRGRTASGATRHSSSHRHAVPDQRSGGRGLCRGVLRRARRHLPGRRGTGRGAQSHLGAVRHGGMGHTGALHPRAGRPHLRSEAPGKPQTSPPSRPLRRPGVSRREACRSTSAQAARSAARKSPSATSRGGTSSRTTPARVVPKPNSGPRPKEEAPPGTANPAPTAVRTQLRELLSQRFNEEELRTLCFDLGIDYDDLGGGSKAGKARELVDYLKRRGRLADLVNAGKERRPDIPWNEIPPLSS